MEISTEIEADLRSGNDKIMEVERAKSMKVTAFSNPQSNENIKKHINSNVYGYRFNMRGTGDYINITVEWNQMENKGNLKR